MTDNRRKPKHISSKKSRRLSRRRFKRGLKYYILTLSVIFVILLIYLTVSLASYQHRYNKSESEKEAETAALQAPQLAFENYYSSMDTSKWIEAWKNDHPEGFDTDDSIRSFMEEHADLSVCSIYRDSSYSDQSPVFLVQSENTDFAVFTMAGSGSDWWVADISFNVSGSESGDISVPDGCTVYCNDQPLGEDYITDSTTPAADFKYSSSIIDPLSYVTYSVSGLLSSPVFTVEAPSEYSVSSDSEGNYYLSLTDDTASSLKSTAYSFTKALLNYFSQGKVNTSENMNAAISLIPSGSDAADIIRQSYDGVIWRYPQDTNYQIDVSDICIISENCYFADVTCRDLNADVSENTVNSADDKETSADDSASEDESSSSASITYRLYFMDLGAGFKIYSFSYL